MSKTLLKFEPPCLERLCTISLLNEYTATAKSLQSCPTLCDPIDGSPPGSAVPGILQARTLEWAAISFSNVWKWKVKVKSLSRVRLLATPWTAAYQAPPSMGFSRQEYWRGVPLPSPPRKPFIFTFLLFKHPENWVMITTFKASIRMAILNNGILIWRIIWKYSNSIWVF